MQKYTLAGIILLAMLPAAFAQTSGGISPDDSVCDQIGVDQEALGGVCPVITNPEADLPDETDSTTTSVVPIAPKRHGSTGAADIPASNDAIRLDQAPWPPNTLHILPLGEGK